MKEYRELEKKGLLNEVFHGYFHKRESLLAVSVSDEQLKDDQFISKIVESYPCEMLMLMCVHSDTTRIRCVSYNKETRALEFIDFLLQQYGMFRGTEVSAEGEVSSVILKVCMADLDLADETEYFLQRANDYYKECDIIYAKSYVADNAELKEYKKYEKKQIPWAFVKTLSIASKGQQIRIKTLENRTGVLITASEDTYIMVGCRGEVYDISKTKFMTSYDESKEPLDVFEQMLDFIPAVEVLPEGTYITIDEMANLCYPKSGNAILAKPINRRTKVYLNQDNKEYFIGNAGDYLAIRCDDKQDVYIIQEEIFHDTYQEVV